MSRSEYAVAGPMKAAIGVVSLEGLGSGVGKGSAAEATAHDPLKATLLLVSGGGRELLLTSCDITNPTPTHMGPIGEALAAEGLGPESFVFHGVHTHSSYNESGFDFAGLAGRIAEGLRDLRTRLVPVSGMELRQAGLPTEAVINRRFHYPNPDFGATCIMFNDDCILTGDTMDVTGQLTKFLATLGASPADAGLGERNILSGPADRRVHLLTLLGEDVAPIAAVCRFTGHPVIVSLFWTKNVLSADYTHYTGRRIEEAVGCPVVLLNGTFGDVRPRNAEYSFAEAERHGRLVADTVLGSEATAMPAGAVRVVHAVARVPRRTEVPRSLDEMATRLVELNRMIEAERRSHVKKKLLDERETVFFAHRNNGVWTTDRIESADVEVTAKRVDLGPLSLMCVGGEPLTRFAEVIERATGAMVVGCCDWTLGYLPAPEDLALGSYEATYGILGAEGLRSYMDLASTLT